ncbi:META domain-containing protein [uncultured Streptomyces sp.]|uniref:META domain-containing protein n=1 Tax=uncultured Streptomyces sp. TaxID=174707 RepID=UPI00262D2E26|nr:META domain-containing protein [uncultured Streptomyces sp.]
MTLSLLALLALTACGGRTGSGGTGADDGGGSPGTGAPLTGTVWKVTGLLSGETPRARALPTGSEGRADLTFGEDGTVHGSLGCNTFRGEATIAGTTVTLGPLATTRKLCPGPRTELERALTAVLRGELSYAVEDRGLSLTARGGAGVRATAVDGDGTPAPE